MYVENTPTNNHLLYCQYKTKYHNIEKKPKWDNGKSFLKFMCIENKKKKEKWEDTKNTWDYFWQRLKWPHFIVQSIKVSFMFQQNHPRKIHWIYWRQRKEDFVVIVSWFTRKSSSRFYECDTREIFYPPICLGKQRILEQNVLDIYRHASSICRLLIYRLQKPHLISLSVYIYICTFIFTSIEYWVSK